jgi:hypothetical protein
MQIGNYDLEYIHNFNYAKTNNENQEIKGNISEIKEKNSEDLIEGRYTINNNQIKNERFESNYQILHDRSDESLPSELLYILSKLQEEKENPLCKGASNSISFVPDKFMIENGNHGPNDYFDPGLNNHPDIEYLGMDNHSGVDELGIEVDLNLDMGGDALKEEEAIKEDKYKNKVIDDYLGMDNHPGVEYLGMDWLDDILIQETLAKDLNNNDDVRNNDDVMIHDDVIDLVIDGGHGLIEREILRPQSLNSDDSGFTHGDIRGQNNHDILNIYIYIYIYIYI